MQEEMKGVKQQLERFHRESEALEKRFEAIGEQMEETRGSVESELASQIAAVKAMIPASDSSTVTALTSSVHHLEVSLRQAEVSLTAVKDLSDHTSKRLDSSVATLRGEIDFTSKRAEEHRRQEKEVVSELERKVDAMKVQTNTITSQPHSKRGSASVVVDATASDSASFPVTTAILPAVEAAISRRSSLLATTAPASSSADSPDIRIESADSVSEASGLAAHHRASIAVLRDRNESTTSIDEYAGRSSQPSISMMQPPETRSAQLSMSDIPESRSSATSVSSNIDGNVATPGHNHRASSAELLARKYADEMARMRREFEERLEGERLATEAAQLLLQKKRESIITSAAHSNRSSVDLSSTTGSFASFRHDRTSSTDSTTTTRTARSSRKGSTLSNNGDRGTTPGGGHFLGSDDVVEEGEEEQDEEEEEEDESSSDFLSSSASNGNLFGLDSPTAKKKSSISESSPSITATVSAAAALPTMATYEMQLAAMKAEYERKVAEEREMTLKRKAELLNRRDTITASSPTSASSSISSRPTFLLGI